MKIIKNQEEASIIVDDKDLTFTLFTANFSEKERQCYQILKSQILLNDDNVIVKIISDRIEIFYIWWNVNEK